MTAWTKLAIGVAVVSISVATWVTSVLWGMWVSLVGLLHWLIEVIGA